MSTTDRIEQQAAQWLERREQPDWSAADQDHLDAWLEADSAHKLAYWRLEHGWAKVGRLAALRRVPPPGRSPRRRLRLWEPVLAAASIAAVVALGVIQFGLLDLGQQRYETPVGGHQTLPLADGSRIELSTNTRVRTAVTTDAREVWLDRGEAYFEVKHDTGRPFVVWAGVRKVTVLGTRFSVRRDGDQVRVAVVEGKVRVDPVNADAPIRPEVATPGEIVVAQGPSTLVADASVEQVSDALSWRHGMLTFDRATLAEAAAEFNRYNATKLVLGDASAAQIRIGGTFEAQNAEAFTRLLASAYGLRVVRKGEEIVISR